MYVWINSEAWCGAGQPPLTESHGWLADPTEDALYGRILDEAETAVVAKALLDYRRPPQPTLLDSDGV
jgi:hypothetical protein